MNTKEITLYGLKDGEESWEEQLITAAPDTTEGRAKIEKAKAWATANGFTTLRTAGIDLAIAPDFTKVVR